MTKTDSEGNTTQVDDEHDGPKSAEDEITESPTGDVQYDPEALREARERMHAGGHGERNLDPTGGHDAKALEDAANKIGSD